ncbi:MAG: hypothetical protein H6736_14315 [Alphaproteobacteria bacterium]|nr:hypothetical protein [Alphaproteobacteria bacterium]
MLWTAPAWAASVVVLGDAPFRAPDGVSDVAVADDGSAVVLSPRGEIARFDRSGRLLGTFQACPDRMARVDFAVAPKGDRLGISCGTSYRIWSATGTAGPVLEIDATHAALSLDGRRVGILGERFVGEATEDRSFLFEVDAVSGEILRAWEGEWDRVVATPSGWVVARGDDDGRQLSLRGFVERPGQSTIQWSFDVPAEKLKGGGWTTDRVLSTRGGLVCVTHDNGGSCYDSANGAPGAAWTPADRPFRAPGPDAIAWSPGRKASLEVRATHLRVPGRAFPSWTLPRDVDVGEGRIVVTDLGGTVWDVTVGSQRVITSTVGDAALSADGRWLWVPTGTGSTRMDLAGGPLQALPAFPVATFDGEALVALQGRSLVRVEPGDTKPIPGPALPTLFEVTGLQARGGVTLVDFLVADRFAVVGADGSTLASGPHVYHSTEDLALVGGGPVETRTAATREVGPPGGPYRSLPVDAQRILRLLPDGTVAALDGDGTGLELHRAGGVERLELPGRTHDAWATAGRLIVALRDGRIAVVTTD